MRAFHKVIPLMPADSKGAATQAGNGAGVKLKFHIMRHNPQDPASVPHLQTYELEQADGMTLFIALTELREKQDPSLHALGSAIMVTFQIERAGGGDSWRGTAASDPQPREGSHMEIQNLKLKLSAGSTLTFTVSFDFVMSKEDAELQKTARGRRVRPQLVLCRCKYCWLLRLDPRGAGNYIQVCIL